MDDRFRDAEGQLDLFQEPKKVTWRLLPFIVIAIVLMMVGLASAQQPMFLTTALLCDSEEQAIDQVDAIASGDAHGVTPAFIEGCGHLAYPSPAILTPTSVHENKYMTVQMVRIDIPGLPPQYGYSAYTPKVPDKGV